MVGQGAMGRFAHWGLTHGPVWGTLAGAFAGIPLAGLLDMSMSYVELLVLGTIAGLIAGPVLAILVGVVCLAAEHAPRWILDAPDYVAAVTVIGVVALIAWPTLRMADAGATVAVLGVALIAAPPMIDAARSAPRLVRSRQPTSQHLTPPAA